MKYLMYTACILSSITLTSCTTPTQDAPQKDQIDTPQIQSESVQRDTEEKVKTQEDASIQSALRDKKHITAESTPIYDGSGNIVPELSEEEKAEIYQKIQELEKLDS